MGAWIPKAQKLNPFENQTFQSSVFEWWTIRPYSVIWIPRQHSQLVQVLFIFQIPKSQDRWISISIQKSAIRCATATGWNHFSTVIHNLCCWPTTLAEIFEGHLLLLYNGPLFIPHIYMDSYRTFPSNPLLYILIVPHWSQMLHLIFASCSRTLRHNKYHLLILTRHSFI